MPKQEGQKSKLVTLLRILEQRTDENHRLNVPQLVQLLENQGIVLARATLMDRVWGMELERENRTLDVHVRTLRAKLGPAGGLIETVRGVGYRLEVQP